MVFGRSEQLDLSGKNKWIKAFFVYMNMLRILAVQASSLKKGDGLDFCHAVMACAFASFATLDKRWKHRVASLPTPNRHARIYFPSELDQMAVDIEWAVMSERP
jgi:hypothetical protein